MLARELLMGYISFWNDYIYINRQDKTIIVLNKEDLNFIDEVKP